MNRRANVCCVIEKDNDSKIGHNNIKYTSVPFLLEGRRENELTPPRTTP
jgi:hypothetical protein